jgi:hypothetical protein
MPNGGYAPYALSAWTGSWYAASVTYAGYSPPTGLTTTRPARTAATILSRPSRGPARVPARSDTSNASTSSAVSSTITATPPDRDRSPAAHQGPGRVRPHPWSRRTPCHRPGSLTRTPRPRSCTLHAAIEAYLQANNDDPKPFIWTAAAEEILEKVRRGRATLESITT